MLAFLSYLFSPTFSLLPFLSYLVSPTLSLLPSFPSLNPLLDYLSLVCHVPSYPVHVRYHITHTLNYTTTQPRMQAAATPCGR